MEPELRVELFDPRLEGQARRAEASESDGEIAISISGYGRADNPRGAVIFIGIDEDGLYVDAFSDINDPEAERLPMEGALEFRFRGSRYTA